MKVGVVQKPVPQRYGEVGVDDLGAVAVNDDAGLQVRERLVFVVIQHGLVFAVGAIWHYTVGRNRREQEKLACLHVHALLPFFRLF